jgi:DNA repair protein RecN (Recombination protein N)
VHAQNETILAFDTEARLELLDAFARIDSAAVREAFASWCDARARLEDLERGEQDRLRMVDLWSFQRKELVAAKLEAGEDERLENEKRVLANAEKIYSLAMSTYELLYESDASAAARLRAAARNLQQLATYEARFEEPAAMLDSACLMAEDVGATLRDYAAGIDASPARLAAVEDRLATLDLLKRKYGPALDQVLAYRDEVTRKLDEVENRDELLQRLRAELDTAAKAYLAAARTTSTARRSAAAQLERAVESEINDLAMKASFKVAIEGGEAEEHWSADGFDRVAYLISTNPGEPLKPVERIASGGELSRVMLALKATVEGGASRRSGSQRTLIFDEIDSGIGGGAAEAVGKKLKSLARAHQVLCITHLPQIASFADHHYVIEKKAVAGRTRTSIRRLSIDERTEEVARMLSGAKLSDTSRKHAEQMLKANA